MAQFYITRAFKSLHKLVYFLLEFKPQRKEAFLNLFHLFNLYFGLTVPELLLRRTL